MSTQAEGRKRSTVPIIVRMRASERDKHGHDRLCWLSQNARTSARPYEICKLERPSNFLW
jgi:hypothetical protein